MTVTKSEELRNQGERLVVIEEKIEQNLREHEEFRKTLNNISCKLDTVIERKADKTELQKLNSQLWWVATTVIIMLFSIIAYFVRTYVLTGG